MNSPWLIASRRSAGVAPRGPRGPRRTRGRPRAARASSGSRSRRSRRRSRPPRRRLARTPVSGDARVARPDDAAVGAGLPSRIAADAHVASPWDAPTNASDGKRSHNVGGLGNAPGVRTVPCTVYPLALAPGRRFQIRHDSALRRAGLPRRRSRRLRGAGREARGYDCRRAARLARLGALAPGEPAGRPHDGPSVEPLAKPLPPPGPRRAPRPVGVSRARIRPQACERTSLTHRLGRTGRVPRGVGIRPFGTPLGRDRTDRVARVVTKAPALAQ